MSISSCAPFSRVRHGRFGRFILILVVCLAASAVLAGCTQKDSNKDSAVDAAVETPIIPVRVIAASTGSFSITGEYYGRVEPSSKALLSVPAGGRVEALSAREGDRVSVGMSLGKIDARRIQEKVSLASQSELIARDTYNRQKELYEKGSVSKLLMDQSKLQWLNAQASLTDAKKLLDGALCISPLDGIVLSRYVELYDEIAPGMPSFSVGNIDTLIAKVGIPESEIGSIAEGTEVSVSFSSYPGLTEKGVLTRLSRNTSDRTVTFEGVIEFPNTTGSILPGITSRITLERNTLENVITLPLEAVLNTVKGSVVMLEINNAAVEAPVILGPTDGKRVVIESGIKTGDKVILGGNHVVSAGKPVQPVLQ